MSRNDDKNNETGEIVSKGMDRREFIKRTAVGVGAVAVGMTVTGCGSSTTAASPDAAALVAPVGANSKTAWQFAVMGDTQWVATYDDGKNPDAVPVDIINALNKRFTTVHKDLKFVVQVGDMTENASSTNLNTATLVGSGGAQYTYTNLQAEGTHAAFVQTLYNAGIGFFVHRGNHDSDPTTAAEFVRIYPQTGNSPNGIPAGTMNATPADVFTIPNADNSVQPFPSKSGSAFQIGSNFSSPSAADVGSDNLKGLTYSFDFQNARFVLIDQFNPPDNKGPNGQAAYSINTTVVQQQPWIGKVLSNKPAGVQHTFVFSHKGLTTQQHIDTLFGDCPADALSAVYNGKTQTGSVGMNDFIRTLSGNKAKLYFCGHDHIHNRSLIKTTDDNGSAQVTHILCQSSSSKFYTPNENNAVGQAPVPPCTSNDAFYCPTTPVSVNGRRQTQLSQELYTVGYYIVTVDGANVTVDYYSAPTYSSFSSGKENQITTTPILNFTKRETFGYSQVGKQFVLGNGDSFTAVQDAGPSGTTVKILSGTNNNPTTDPSGRKFYNDVNTGWYAKTNYTASDILALFGMGYTLGSAQTDEYTLSLTYDTKKAGALVLATPDGNGNWINAVDQNLAGAKKFVTGPWKAGYALGTYGIDAASATVWAVLNYNGYFAAVAGV